MSWTALADSLISEIDFLETKVNSSIPSIVLTGPGELSQGLGLLFKIPVYSEQLTLSPFGLIDQLVVEEFTEEQIWEQIDQQNVDLLEKAKSFLSDRCHLYDQNFETTEYQNQDDVDIESLPEEYNHDSDDISYDPKLADVLLGDAAVDEEEETPEEEEDVDALLWNDIDDLKDDTKYDDFFDPPASEQKEEQHDLAIEEMEYSPFQKEQLRIQEQIQRLEEENLGEKDWDMIGEVDSRSRPKNSLLDKHLDFEISDKIQPEITQEVNEDIEGMLKQRIADEAWDDVEKKEEPVLKDFKSKTAVDSEKSELGLGDLYEKEYVEKMTGITQEGEELKAEHRQAAELFASLCYSIDSLTNFQYSPFIVKKPSVSKEVSAVDLEEVQPILQSASASSPPEQCFAPETDRTAVVGISEKGREEKRTERRKRKRHAHVGESKKSKSSKDEGKKKHPAKMAAETDTTNYNKSSQFFEKMEQLKR